jgi:Fe-Mn family superoxide dismutase
MENENSRRDFIKKSAALALGTIAATTFANKALAATEFLEKENHLKDDGKFTLPPLAYGYDGLEPFIDKMTMEIHHNKHHQAYVDNLNKALETVDTTILAGPPTFENIFDKVAKLPAPIRNNVGGHYNHSLYWSLMIPNGGGPPLGQLGEAITKTFGSFDEFKKQFAEEGMKRFGSGWVWLVKTPDGKLAISSTPNQDNPLMNLDSVEVKGAVVLALDVWEHAYYLKNQNRRADYITAWWNVINWETAQGFFIGK